MKPATLGFYRLARREDSVALERGGRQGGKIASLLSRGWVRRENQVTRARYRRVRWVLTLFARATNRIVFLQHQKRWRGVGVGVGVGVVVKARLRHLTWGVDPTESWMLLWVIFCLVTVRLSHLAVMWFSGHSLCWELLKSSEVLYIVASGAIFCLFVRRWVGQAQ